MGYPSGYFSSASAGQLIVTFAGVYGATTYDFGAGSSDIFIDCLLRNASGTVVGRATLNKGAGGATLTADYPGGNQAWYVSMEYITHNIRGAGTVIATNLRINVRLAKR